jgi:hypothetical protein
MFSRISGRPVPTFVSCTLGKARSPLEYLLTHNRSIFRRFSLSPLMLSRELLLKVLAYHNIGPAFLDLLPAFRVVDELSEKGNSLWSTHRDQDGEIGMGDLNVDLRHGADLRQSSVITSGIWRRTRTARGACGPRGRSAFITVSVGRPKLSWYFCMPDRQRKCPGG